MTHPWFALAAAASMAACGGTSAPDPTTPANGPGDGHADHDQTGQEPGDGDDAAGGDPTAPSGATDPSGGGAVTPADPAQVKAELLAAEKTAYESARPVFDKYCAACHTKGGKKAKPKVLGHFNMTSYPFGGHHAREVAAEVRKALGVGGGEPTMPFNDPGAVKGDELALIAAWADAFDRAHTGGAHEGEAGHHKGGHKH